MTSTLNVSSIILKTYPEVSPWDLDGICFIRPLEYRPVPPYSDALYRAALMQAQKTGLNPFYIFCSNNPFVLDTPNISSSPLRLPTFTTAYSLANVDSLAITLLDVLCGQTDHIVCRAVVAGTTRTLKLVGSPSLPAFDIKLMKLLLQFLGDDASALFDNELAAYIRFLRCGTASSQAVLQCHGWVEVEEIGRAHV